jgi:pSer/pThr/pTyr-binding forkhead associated (FHA) protein
MPAILFDRDRYTLPVGETAIGGDGDGALPFPAIRRLPLAGKFVVSPTETTILWPHPKGVDGLTVNGVPLGTAPVRLTHGTRIDVAGMRMIFRDGRESGTTGPVTIVSQAQPAVAESDPGDSSVYEGAHLVHRRTKALLPIIDSGLVIGRDPDSDLVVSGLEVSRRHAVLRRSIRGYVLTDVSTNGTYVNGHRIGRSRVLRAGDTIRIAGEEFAFEAGSATYDPAATPVVPGPERLAEAPTPVLHDSGVWRRLGRMWGRRKR